jgi:putative ABC transport system substrate-binding protein
MRRRDFIKSIAGSAVAWPHAAHAQQAAVPVVGFVYPGTSESDADIAAAFRKGLGETGYIDGANVAVEYRWAGNDTGKLQTLVEDLVHRQVAVIATGGNVARSSLRRSRRYRSCSPSDSIQFNPVLSPACRGPAPMPRASPL